ncbi:MAG: MBL fold metallo-hydrolase [bacterium]|nr:MBL fold metallo-hydrolase [bacterium]
MMLREVVPGILGWSVFSEPHGYDWNGWLVQDAGGSLCIDPVDPGAEGLEQLAELGVARILLTNRNHSRAAARVKERTGASIAIHDGDAAYARDQGTPVDATLLPGEQLGPLVVTPVPGKSPGEVAFHWPARRLLIVGDAVVGKPPGQLALLREKVLDDPARLRASVRALLELDLDVLLLGDGAPILSNANARLRELVAGFPA